MNAAAELRMASQRLGRKARAALHCHLPGRCAAAAALAAVLFLAACGKQQRCDVPIGEATFSINPDSPQYPGLNNCDGFEYFVGGNQGIVVIRTGHSTFMAYERTCPYDLGRLEIPTDTVWQGGIPSITYPHGNLVLQCPRCGSRFINTDGAPLEGSKSFCYLYHYSTYLDPSTGLLYISN